MNKVAKMVFSVMLIMAVILVCFNVGSKTSFTESFQSFLSPLTSLSEFGLKVIRTMTDDPLFKPDDEIYVMRFEYSRDGVDYYVDVLCYDAVFATLQKDVLGYSNDPTVYSMEIFPFFQLHRFNDKNGDPVYIRHVWSPIPKTLRTTYEEYQLIYERNPSTENWS